MAYFGLPACSFFLLGDFLGELSRLKKFASLIEFLRVLGFTGLFAPLLEMMYFFLTCLKLVSDVL